MVTCASVLRVFLTAALLLGMAGTSHAAGDLDDHAVQEAVDAVIRPLMERNSIPGMAVGITVGGRHHVLNYGTASLQTGEPVTEATIFEVGSVTKVFTGTLSGNAVATGKLRLSDLAGSHWAELAGSPTGSLTLLDLGTYTAGGFPLQFPKGVGSGAALADYYRTWKPDYAPGTQRVYSNPSLGLFGNLTARSVSLPFEGAMRETVFAALALENTFFQVPGARMADYAHGYTSAGEPVRAGSAPFAAETYGVRTTAGDLLRLVDAGMDGSALSGDMAAAAEITKTGYYRVGPMVQGLGWEVYPAGASLEVLLTGNAVEMSLQPNPSTRIDPPQPAAEAHLINKTGATFGFGAYVIAAPHEEVGVVLLANRNYPIPARVEAGYEILTALLHARPPENDR